MRRRIKKTNTGYSLVETIFYVSLFAILSIILLDAMMMMTGLFMKTMTSGDIVQGSTIMENISRELRQANDFSFAPNVLTVSTKDSSNNAKTIVYTFSNSNLQITDSALGNLGNLNTPNVSVTSFNITPINTSKGKAAKIDLAIKSNREVVSNTENFENTIILRGSY